LFLGKMREKILHRGSEKLKKNHVGIGLKVLTKRTRGGGRFMASEMLKEIAEWRRLLVPSATKEREEKKRETSLFDR